MEASEYGSKDDSSTYQWAARQIHLLSDAGQQFRPVAKFSHDGLDPSSPEDSVQLQTSAAEKYRTLTVVAFNARTTGVDGVAGHILQ